MNSTEGQPRNTSEDRALACNLGADPFAALSDDVVNEVFQCLLPVESARMGMTNRRLNTVVKNFREPAAQQALVQKLKLNSGLWPRSVRKRPLEVLHRGCKPFAKGSEPLNFFHLKSCSYSPDGRYLMTVSAKPNYENRQYDAFLDELTGGTTPAKRLKIPGGHDLTSSPDAQHVLVQRPGAIELFSRDAVSDCVPKSDHPESDDQSAWHLAYELPLAVSTYTSTSMDQPVTFSDDSKHVAICGEQDVIVLSKNANTGHWQQSFSASAPNQVTQVGFDGESRTLALLSANAVQFLSLQVSLQEDKATWADTQSIPLSRGVGFRFHDDGESVLVTCADSVSLLSKTGTNWGKSLSVENRTCLSKVEFTPDQNHCLIISQDHCDLLGRGGPQAPWTLKFSRAVNAISDAQVLRRSQPGSNDSPSSAPNHADIQVLMTQQREFNTPFNIVKENARLTLLERREGDWHLRETLSQRHVTLGPDDGESIYITSSDGNHIAMRNSESVKVFSRAAEEGHWDRMTELNTNGTTINAFFLPGGKHLYFAERVPAPDADAQITANTHLTKVTILSVNEDGHWSSTLSLIGNGLYGRTLDGEENLIIIGSTLGDSMQVYEAQAVEPSLPPTPASSPPSSIPQQSKSVVWIQGNRFTPTDLFDGADRPWRFELSPDKNDLLVKGLKTRVAFVSR
jgi:hypothetical protein